MILVTGLPRTSSSFLCQLFKEKGDQMTPQCYCDNLPTSEAMEQGLMQQLCEPITLTHEMTFNQHYVHDQIIEEINNIHSYNIQFSDNKEQVLKCSQMVFFKYCLYRFSTVIICFRDKESWIKSARNHGTLSWIYKCRPYWIDSFNFANIINSSNPDESLYDYWLNHAEKTFTYCLDHKIPVLKYEYANDQSLKNITSFFKAGFFSKHEYFDFWIERRF